MGLGASQNARSWRGSLDGGVIASPVQGQRTKPIPEPPHDADLRQRHRDHSAASSNVAHENCGSTRFGDVDRFYTGNCRRDTGAVSSLILRRKSGRHKECWIESAKAPPHTIDSSEETDPAALETGVSDTPLAGAGKLLKRSEWIFSDITLLQL